MTNQQLRDQFARCLEWQDADQWEALAYAYHARGLFDNAARCFRKADDIRDCSFSESMTARALPLAGVEVDNVQLLRQ
jgi:hypothetical protein